MINLYDIKDPSFVKSLKKKELKELALEIRKFLIENISKTGGHLSSNLGVVELTIAMYYVFDPEVDKFIFDVGHQSYVHKILTGRAKDFATLRSYNGLCGYIKRSESKYDVWESGHSSTSISAASGMILASDNDERVISVIGDTSIANGVAMEGLNFVGQLKDKNPIIVLNDNKMGISRSVGSFAKIFNRMRGSKLYRGSKKVCNTIFPGFITRFFHQIKRGIKAFIQQDNVFEDMGFDYYGPYDGNNLNLCIKMMKKIKKCKKPAILHLHTKKGKGYEFSEADTTGDFHGVTPFDIKTGKPLKTLPANEKTYSAIVADYLVNKRGEEEFFVVTPAMKAGAALEEFSIKYPKSFYDVGIAEEHAAVMSAGIAISNKKVVLLMYSTFAQRAYDQILNDIARQNIPVIIGLDRAGIVGQDGSTHQGLYDLAMLMEMPNIQIVMPRNAKETVGLFNYIMDNPTTPMAIRYPRGTAIIDDIDYSYKASLNWEKLTSGTKLNVISYGTDVETIANIGLDINVYDAKCLKPIDTNTLKEIFENGLPILVVEQVVASGTLFDKVLEFKEANNYNNKVYSKAFDCDTIVPHGKLDEVYDAYGFSKDKLKTLIEEIINK